MELPFEVPKSLFPVEHRFIELNGARIHYVDEGKGDTLLLLHGNPSWSFLYRKMIPPLRNEFRCVAPDYPGYGMSSAPPGYGFTPPEHSAVLEKFVDKLGIKDLTMMVQDWGGPVGLGLAGRRPELVKRLVIGNTFAWPLNESFRVQMFSRMAGGPVGRALTLAFNFTPKLFFKRGLAQKISPEVLALYLAPWKDRGRRKPATIAPRQLIKAAPYLREVESNLHKIADRPALIVWGTADFAFGEAERTRFESIFKDHETILFEKASHFLQEDEGERIAEAIRAFSKKHPIAQSSPARGNGR